MKISVWGKYNNGITILPIQIRDNRFRAERFSAASQRDDIFTYAWPARPSVYIVRVYC